MEIIVKFKEFYICDINGNSNCVIRSLSKAYNEDYNNVCNELNDISKELKMSFNDIEVIEEYMKRRNTLAINYGKDLKIKDLSLDNSTYIILCWDKKDFYHMITIINNTLYDRTDESLELYVITIYKEN